MMVLKVRADIAARNPVKRSGFFYGGGCKSKKAGIE
jgi:hypothetical protein